MNPTTPLAENHIRISRPLFNEGMRATENKAYKKLIQKLSFILLALYLAAAIWILYTGGSLSLLFGESIFLAALFLWLFIMLPGTKRRSKYKAMALAENNIPERTIKCYQDHLSVITSTGKETIIKYHDIRSCQETKNLYILSCNNSLHILLDKNGFAIGDFRIIESLLSKD